MRPARFGSFLFSGVAAMRPPRADAFRSRDIVDRVQVALAHLSGRAIAPAERRSRRLGPSTRAALSRFLRRLPRVSKPAASWRLVAALDAAMLAQQVEPRPRTDGRLCPCCAGRLMRLPGGLSSRRSAD
jgi:hypothetical protein